MAPVVAGKRTVQADTDGIRGWIALLAGLPGRADAPSRQELKQRFPKR